MGHSLKKKIVSQKRVSSFDLPAAYAGNPTTYKGFTDDLDKMS